LRDLSGRLAPERSEKHRADGDGTRPGRWTAAEAGRCVNWRVEAVKHSRANAEVLTIAHQAYSPATELDDGCDSLSKESRVLIVDDTRLFREGLAGILAREAGISAVDTAADIEAGLRLLKTCPPDVVLLNMATADGVGVLDALVRAAPQVRVVAIGVSETEDEVIACAEAGVAGYLLRRESLVDLVETIQSVTRGETLCSPWTAATLLRRVATLADERRSWFDPAKLTSREGEILLLIEQGCSNKEIAQHLFIEVRTVKNHVHNLLEKLQVHRRGEAAARMRAARAGASAE
jgi:two-component system, NarL family, nitrate/nitrite response regulator NarL